MAVGGLLAVLDRAKDFVLANTVPVAAGTTAAGVAAAVVISGGVGIGHGGHEPLIDSSRPPSQASGSESTAGRSADGAAGGSAMEGSGDGARPGSGPHAKRTGTHPGSRGQAPGTPGPAPSHESGGPAVPVEASGPPSSTPSATPTPGPPSGVPSQGGQGEQGQDNQGQGNQGQGGQGQGTPSGQPTSKPEPSHPAPSASHPSGPPERDVSLTLDGWVVGKAVGRFHARVSDLPVAQGPTEVRLDLSFSNPAVHLQSIPHGCSYAGSTAVVCYGSGGTWSGIFDADLGGMSLGQTTTVTVTASAADVTDPDTSNNAGSVVLQRVGS